MDEYLEHHGTKGMRWGIRRYQNKDGSLTEAGRRRLSASKQGDKILDESDHLKSDPISRSKGTSILRDEVSKDYRNLGDLSSNISNLSRSMSRGQNESRTRKEIRKLKKEMKKAKLENLSDDDLRQAINRLQMERSYQQLTSEKISSGKKQTKSRLERIGELAAVGSSITGILIAINELKK